MKKADNFDATKWLVENKITTQSRLKEDESSPYYKLGYQIGPNGRRATVDTQSTEYNTIEEKANQLTSLLNDKDLIDFAKGSTDSIGSSRARYEGLQDVASSLLFFDEIKNRLGKSNTNENQINEIDVDKEALMSQFEEQWKDQSPEYLDLVGTDPIYKGLDAVVNNPKVKQEAFDWAYELTADDEDEDALEMFGAYVQDSIDYEIMKAFAPQLAKNLIAAGFTYDKDEDIWTIPQSYLDKIGDVFDYSNGATSYGIIWDVWNMDYDTSPRELIGDYLKDAAEAL